MSGQHPYANLPAERYWRKAVAGVPPFALDPTRPDAFRIGRTERIATAGSCFAQQLARVLRGAGYNYLVTEPPAPGADGPEENFSARYGNVYTTRQLVQLFDRAFGGFRPALVAWARPDGRYVDPFRPRLDPEGQASPEAVAAARDAHLARVRALFTELDTLVFTLGLTEGWRDRRDGAALQIPPGVAGGTWDPAETDFVQASVAEMSADLNGFVDRLRSVNARARLILTVSPVPIIATYEDRHVLVANGYSKSALRVAADEACRARPDVHYFPSYEVVTSPATAGRYYADNLRAVNEAGIAHVMRLFLAHAEGGGPSAGARGGATPVDLRREGAHASEVICDEEALDA